MVNENAALSHHLFEVTQAQSIGQVPANALGDDIDRVMESFEVFSDQRRGRLLEKIRGILPEPSLNATEPAIPTSPRGRSVPGRAVLSDGCLKNRRRRFSRAPSLIATEPSLSLASPQPDVAIGNVLDQPCELQVWFNGQLQRRVHGVVSSMTQGDSGFRRTHYYLEVRPELWRLGLRHNARIFQAKTAQEIISTTYEPK